MTYPPHRPEPLPPTGPRTAVLDDLDNVAVTALERHAVFHRIAGDVTGCGLPMNEMRPPPYPGLWRVRRHWFGSPCPACYRT